MATEDIPSVATEMMSSVATEEMSSVATEEMSSVATEAPPAVFWAQQNYLFSIKARCEVPRLPPVVLLGPKNNHFFSKSQV